MIWEHFLPSKLTLNFRTPSSLHPWRSCPTFPEIICHFHGGDYSVVKSYIWLAAKVDITEINFFQAIFKSLLTRFSLFLWRHFQSADIYRDKSSQYGAKVCGEWEVLVKSISSSISPAEQRKQVTNICFISTKTLRWILKLSPLIGMIFSSYDAGAWVTHSNSRDKNWNEV